VVIPLKIHSLTNKTSHFLGRTKVSTLCDIQQLSPPENLRHFNTIFGALLLHCSLKHLEKFSAMDCQNNTKIII